MPANDEYKILPEFRQYKIIYEGSVKHTRVERCSFICERLNMKCNAFKGKNETHVICNQMDLIRLKQFY